MYPKCIISVSPLYALHLCVYACDLYFHYLSSLFSNCIQNDVMSQCLSWNLRPKKLRRIRLPTLKKIFEERAWRIPAVKNRRRVAAENKTNIKWLFHYKTFKICILFYHTFNVIANKFFKFVVKFSKDSIEIGTRSKYKLPHP